MNSINVKFAYNEFGLLLNEKNFFYWNLLNDDEKNRLIQDLKKEFECIGIVPSVTELNITLRFMLTAIKDQKRY